MLGPNCQRDEQAVGPGMHKVSHGKHKQDTPDSAALPLNYALILFTLCFIQPCRGESHLIYADNTV